MLAGSLFIIFIYLVRRVRSHGQCLQRFLQNREDPLTPAYMDSGHGVYRSECCAFLGTAAVALLTTDIPRIRDIME